MLLHWTTNNINYDHIAAIIIKLYSFIDSVLDLEVIASILFMK